MRSKTDCWGRLYCGIIPFALLFASHAYGVANAVPQPFEVYGGSIGVIDAIEVTGTKTRIFASTESANSVFYADVDYSNPTPFGTNFIFRVLPDMNADANLGAPNWLATHQQSGRVYVGLSNGLLSCTTSSGSLVTNINDPIDFVLIKNSHLFAISDAVPENPRKLYYGLLDSSGSLTKGSLSTNFYGSSVTLAICPVSNKVYLLCSQPASFALYKSADNYDAFSSSTVFTAVSLTGVTVPAVGQVAVGPDGRLFLGGGSSTLKVAWSDNDGSSWTNIDTSGLLAGVGSGLNIVCNGSSNAYEVYYGTVVSTNKGANGSWVGLPRPGGYRPPSMHVNAGCTKVDPNQSQVIYVTTDKGIGGSTNAGTDVVELNNGLLAFQINDIDALPSKTIAWIGSKSGLRIATNFNTIPVWTDGNFAGANVYCVAIDSDDPSGMTGYAGSGNLDRTTTGGGTNASSWVPVFSRDVYGLPDGEIKSVKAKGNFVVLGYYSYTQNSPSGAVYVSTDSGSNWTAAITNVDVNKLLRRDEGGAGVVYTAVSKSKTGDRGGIYRIDSSVELDLTNEVNIRDLAEDSAGGIYASGTLPETSDPGRHRVVVYYRDTNLASWSQLTTNGLPGNLWDGYMLGSGRGPVITIGKDSASNDVPVLAAVRTLYYLPYGGSSWVTVTNYPNGTQIKTLFWDELMVGTTIGLYGQALSAEPATATVEGDIDGDRLADPYWPIKNNIPGQWTFWLSSGGYLPWGPYAITVPGGEPVRIADFDGDGLADPVMVANGGWTLWLSSGGYLPWGPYIFTVPGGAPVAGDFDGDRLADPAMVANGAWTLWLSSGGYLPWGPYIFAVSGTNVTPLAGDFDGDRLADPVMVANGAWTLWLSSGGYLPWGPYIFTVPGTDVMPMTGDFDGDGLADPTMVVNDNWTFWFSSGGYLPWGPYALVP